MKKKKTFHLWRLIWSPCGVRTSEKKKKMATPLPDGLLRTVHFEEVGGWGVGGGVNVEVAFVVFGSSEVLTWFMMKPSKPCKPETRETQKLRKTCETQKPI